MPNENCRKAGGKSIDITRQSEWVVADGRPDSGRGCLGRGVAKSATYLTGDRLVDGVGGFTHDVTPLERSDLLLFLSAFRQPVRAFAQVCALGLPGFFVRAHDIHAK